jgi:hypothetical protein
MEKRCGERAVLTVSFFLRKDRKKLVLDSKSGVVSERDEENRA